MAGMTINLKDEKFWPNPQSPLNIEAIRNEALRKIRKYTHPDLEHLLPGPVAWRNIIGSGFNPLLPAPSDLLLLHPSDPNSPLNPKNIPPRPKRTNQKCK